MISKTTTQSIELFSRYLGSPVTCEQEGYHLRQSVQPVAHQSSSWNEKTVVSNYRYNSERDVSAGTMFHLVSASQQPSKKPHNVLMPTYKSQDKTKLLIVFSAVSCLSGGGHEPPDLSTCFCHTVQGCIDHRSPSGLGESSQCPVWVRHFNCWNNNSYITAMKPL